jgi:hypothetical protein
MESGKCLDVLVSPISLEHLGHATPFGRSQASPRPLIAAAATRANSTFFHRSATSRSCCSREINAI